MAIDMFLKLDQIVGESTDKVHAGDIEILSYSWGVSAETAHMKGAGGVAVGKASFSDLSVMKYQDSSSTSLFTSIALGKHYTKAVLVNRKTGGNAPVEFSKITLSDVYVTSIQTSGSNGGDSRLMESVSFTFGKVEIEYKTTDQKGAVAQTLKAGWDLKSNTTV